MGCMNGRWRETSPFLAQHGVLEAVVWERFSPSDRLADLAHKQFRVDPVAGELFFLNRATE